MTALLPIDHADAATCVNTVGPGIPPPAREPSGLPGFHASWHGQSGYTSLCPGASAIATVAFHIPGTYRVALRPLIEGAQWMEDHGVFWVVTVLNPDGTSPPPAPSAPVATTVMASYFGPGLYGNRTACGLTMTTTLQGVAHRTLPCASLVHLAYAGRDATVPVVDRRPNVTGREFDVTYTTKLALGCPDLCVLSWIH